MPFELPAKVHPAGSVICWSFLSHTVRERAGQSSRFFLALYVLLFSCSFTNLTMRLVPRRSAPSDKKSSGILEAGDTAGRFDFHMGGHMGLEQGHVLPGSPPAENPVEVLIKSAPLSDTI